ncbi:MAG: phosphatase PAP2 family protein [Psychroflexus sp.]|nr:phosphatase PAP2 family protein [Psychroflexus sp.]
MAFLCLLSYHFELDFRYSIALLVFCIGLVSSARIYLKAHSFSEVVLGVVLGVVTQLLIPLVKYYRM